MKTLVFILFILLASTADAQNKIDTVGDICVPYPIMKNIQTDLLIGDSVLEMLFFSEEETFLLKQKIAYKDSIIYAHELKEITLNSLITNEHKQNVEVESLYTNCKTEYNNLAKKEKSNKVISKLKSIFGLPVIITLVVLYILK